MFNVGIWMMCRHLKRWFWRKICNQLVIIQNYPFPEYSKRIPIPTKVTGPHILSFLHDLGLQSTFMSPSWLHCSRISSLWPEYTCVAVISNRASVINGKNKTWRGVYVSFLQPVNYYRTRHRFAKNKNQGPSMDFGSCTTPMSGYPQRQLNWALSHHHSSSHIYTSCSPCTLCSTHQATAGPVQLTRPAEN